MAQHHRHNLSVCVHSLPPTFKTKCAAESTCVLPQGGFLLVTPNLTVFDLLVETLRDGDFRPGMGCARMQH